MTIVSNPRAYKIPDWFLNRQKDIKDGRYSQVRRRLGVDLRGAAAALENAAGRCAPSACALTAVGMAAGSGGKMWQPRGSGQGTCKEGNFEGRSLQACASECTEGVLNHTRTHTNPCFR